MLRIWTDSQLVLVSEDNEFISSLSQSLSPGYQLHRLSLNQTPCDTAALLSGSLLLWDLDAAGPQMLRDFLTTHPYVSKTCSLFLISSDPKQAHLAELLEEGAVDFILKPLRPVELSLRLRGATRPWVRAMRTTFEFLSALNIEFTLTEQKLLLCFFAAPDFRASRQDMMAQVWNGASVNRSNLDVHLFNIRRKIESSGFRMTYDNQKASWVLSPKHKDESLFLTKRKKSSETTTDSENENSINQVR